MTRKQVAPPAPRYVRHPKRLEWGVGQIVDDQYGLVRVCFSDGTFRSFRGDVLERVEAVDLPEGSIPMNDISAAPASKPKGAAKAKAAPKRKAVRP